MFQSMKMAACIRQYAMPNKSGAANSKGRGAPVTPDGRYLVVRERLWRCSNPALPEEVRERLVHELMEARSAKGAAMRSGDEAACERARKAADKAKHRLGERGAAWWSDGAPDWNRHMVRNTPYAEWFARLQEVQKQGM